MLYLLEKNIIRCNQMMIFNFLLSEYLIRESTNNIYNKEIEHVYNIDDVINIILVYNNFLAYIVINDR